MNLPITLRILHIIPALKKGGAERICLDMVRSQRKNGATVEVITFRNDNDFSIEFPDILPHAIPCSVQASMFKPWNVNLNEFIQFVNKFQPSIIHSHLFEAEFITRYHLFKGVAYFSHGHDRMPAFKKERFRDFFTKKGLIHWYERKYMLKRYKACNNQFISISETGKKYYSEQFPTVLRKMIHLIPNSIDISRFHPKLHALKDHLELVHIGSLTPIKNQSFLLEVASELATKNISFRLNIIGEGVLKSELEQLASHLNLQEYVKFWGRHDTIESILNKMDIYVHSSHSEEFGLVLIEAMASGLPVVTLNSGGSSELIVHGKNGMLINERNPIQFAEAIIQLKNSELYTEMCQFAVQYASQFDMQNQTTQLLNLYQKVLAECVE
jgi:glycosyltransferase involved in cell wall biosynthesis